MRKIATGPRPRRRRLLGQAASGSSSTAYKGCNDTQSFDPAALAWRPVQLLDRRCSPARSSLHCGQPGLGAGQQAAEHAWIGARNVEDLAAARGPGDQGHGAAADAKRGGQAASVASVAWPSTARALTRTTSAPSRSPPTPGRGEPDRTHTVIRTTPVCLQAIASTCAATQIALIRPSVTVRTSMMGTPMSRPTGRVHRVQDVPCRGRRTPAAAAESPTVPGHQARS
jgi:hypothetical protein